MGGPCEAELSAETREEMVQKMTKHVMENHPETAKEMEAMHKRDPDAWGREFRKLWDKTVES
jgi:hypothetical protein